MIDTVKIVLAYSQRPDWFEQTRSQRTFDMTNGLFKAVTNPSNGYKRRGIYQPRLTYTERPMGQYRKSYELAIELSLPKLMFGNNFTELTDNTFTDIVNKISETIRTTYNIWLFPHLIIQASVRKIDYSKNIIFTDYTPVSSIVNAIGKADTSKVYDTQTTNFKNGGHIYHIHTNSLDVAMYDKIADLKQSKVSEKRSYEKDGYTQLSLLDLLGKAKKPVAVARFEVRLNGKRKITNELKAVGVDDSNLTFQEMFDTDLSRKILLRHWNNLFDRIPKVPLDGDTPEQLLLNLAKAYPTMKAREALAIVTLRLLSKDHEERYIRNLMEALFSKSQYRRLRQKNREPPTACQLKTLIQVTNVLTAMTPVGIEDCV